MTKQRRTFDPSDDSYPYNFLQYVYNDKKYMSPEKSGGLTRPLTDAQICMLGLELGALPASQQSFIYYRFVEHLTYTEIIKVTHRKATHAAEYVYTTIAKASAKLRRKDPCDYENLYQEWKAHSTKEEKQELAEQMKLTYPVNLVRAVMFLNKDDKTWVKEDTYMPSDWEIEVVKERMSLLKEDEIAIIEGRYRDGKTLQECGDEYGITRERIRQKQDRALGVLYRGKRRTKETKKEIKMKEVAERKRLRAMKKLADEEAKRAKRQLRDAKKAKQYAEEHAL